MMTISDRAGYKFKGILETKAYSLKKISLYKFRSISWVALRGFSMANSIRVSDVGEYQS